jgi:hypothetical protein
LQEAEAWVTDLRAKVANKGPNGENMSVPVIMFVNKGADTLLLYRRIVFVRPF